jgi:acetyl esterase/lipase
MGSIGFRWPLAVRGIVWAALVSLTGVMIGAEASGRVDLPAGVEVRPNIVYQVTHGRSVKLDLYRPSGPPPPEGWPAILALHGGGWRGGSRCEYGRSLANLAARGYVVASADYTLSRPGQPSWPANLDDVRAAVRWLRTSAESLHIDRQRIAALGSSAGGHLAELLGTRRADPDERVGAVIALYAPADLVTLEGAVRDPGGPIDLMLGGQFGRVPDKYRDASPAQQVTTDSPPMLLFHGKDDWLVPPAQSEEMARALRRAGVPCRLAVLDGAGHGFGLRVGTRDLAQEILAFLDEAWNHVGGQRGQASRTERPAAATR